MWRLLALLLAFAVLAPAADARVSRVAPRAFTSCRALVTYADRHLTQTHGVASPSVRPLPPIAAAPPENGTAMPVASAPATTDASAVSTTNNQEEGVDEPDLVKTDGRTIFTLARGRLQAVDVTGNAPRGAGPLAVGRAGFASQLLLPRARLIAVGGGGPVVLPMQAVGAPLPNQSLPQTTVTEVDVHDPAAMKVARTMTIDGSYVDARQNGSTARIVISSAPRAIALESARDERTGWIPARRFRSALTGRHYVRRAAPCRAVRHPVAFSGLGMLTILTIDLDRGLWAADSDALMADAQVVYGSGGSLYVATQRWIDPQVAVSRLPVE